MLAGGKERPFNSSYWTIPVRGSCVHMMFCTVISSTNITRKSRNFQEIIQEVANNLVRNYLEIIEKWEIIQK